MSIGVSITIKDRFFDREKVQRAVNAGVVKVLRKAGGKTAKIAKFSIKRRAYDNTSAPGETPYDHAGFVRAKANRQRKKAGKPPLKVVASQKGIRTILFGLAPDNQGVVIGPVKNPSAKGKGVLPALEYGDSSRSSKGERVNIEARPFMSPALDKVVPELPAAFRGVVR